MAKSKTPEDFGPGEIDSLLTGKKRIPADTVKVPSWEETSEIPPWDETQPINDAPAQAPNDGKPAPVDVSWIDAILPSRARAEKENAPMGRQMLARAKDVLTAIPAAAYAAAETVNPRDPKSTRSFKENLADREGGSIGKRIANDPATIPTALMTGGGSTVAQVARAGLKQGLVSAGAHQAENLAEGRKVDPKMAAGEIALSALLPAAAKKGGQVAKAAGKGFMQSILKPSKFLRETEKIDMGDLIETLGSKRPFKGSVAGMAKKAEGLEDALTQQYDDVIAANAAKKVNVRGALGTTRKDFEKAFTDEGKHGDVIGGLEKGADYWKEVFGKQKNTAGWVPLPQAVNMRQSVGRAGKYNANKDPRDLEGVAQFARDLYGNMTAQESRLVPELAPIKSQLSKLYPLREAVENAQGRTANNFYPGLTDNIALASAAQAQKPEMSIPGLLLFLANRTVKNPAAATATYQAGKALEAPGPSQEAMRAAIKRALGQSFRGDED